jgi:hypothetical protein
MTVLILVYSLNYSNIKHKGLCCLVRLRIIVFLHPLSEPFLCQCNIPFLQKSSFNHSKLVPGTKHLKKHNLSVNDILDQGWAPCVQVACLVGRE